MFVHDCVYHHLCRFLTIHFSFQTLSRTESLEETEYVHSAEWKGHRKHVFILSQAGKPIYSRYSFCLSCLAFERKLRMFVFICIKALAGNNTLLIFNKHITCIS